MAINDAEEFDKRRMRREALRHKRQQEQKKLIIGLAIAAFVLIACGVLIFLLSRSRPQQPPTQTTGDTAPLQTQPEQTQPEETEPPEVETTKKPKYEDIVIHFAAAGDLNVTDKTVEAGGPGYDFSKVIQDVLPLLANADLTTLNFEGNLIGTPYGSQSRSAPQKLMEALSTAGVDLIQMANSCAIANGTIGLSMTLENIRAAGMEPVGAWATVSDFKDAGGYTIRNVNGIKVAVVAFTKGMDGMALPSGSEECVNLLYEDYSTTYSKVNSEGIRDILKNVNKEKPDVIIALVHWGSEYNDNRSDTQEDIRDLLLSLGVDAIIGTHPHYVQSIEYDQEQGTLVAYSLGDFLSDGERAGTEYSIILDLEITKNPETGITKITNYSYTPIFTVAEEGKYIRVLRLAQAITAYDNKYVDRVSADTYSDLLYAQERVALRVQPLEEEED